MMNFRDKIRPGTRIYDASGNELGAVDRIEGDTYYVGNRQIPFSAFERMDADRLYVGQAGMRYFSGADMQAEGAARVPLMEERLNVEKRPVNLGEVEVRKEVTSEQVNVPVELTRDEVHVRQEKVDERPITGAEGTPFEEGTIRVPVRGEEAVAQKQAVVTGEVVIDRERTTECQNVTDTVRREVAGVEHDEGLPVEHRTGGVAHWDDIRATRRQNWEQRYGASGRRWQDVEPGHHYAHEMSNDQRYRGRSWAEVEPELRSGYADWSRRRGYMDVPGEDAWQRLH
ncbi:MAG: YsnF/AvaK domain-containing protein, partial [Chloroflexota bacterium]|nr:YsnF/AvaK domain-containing protein [Chloroflexota bacterium]